MLISSIHGIVLTLAIVTGAVGSKHENHSSLKPPQTPQVSTATKRKLLKAIKSIYGAKEAVTIDQLQLRSTSPGWGEEVGVVLLQENRILYLLTDACDNDWSEMDIYVYTLPHTVTAKGRRRCPRRPMRVVEVEVKLK
jgi:hypothetical protein